MNRKLLATTALLMIGLPAFSSPASAGDIVVTCPRGAIVEYQPRTGPANEPLLNIDPIIVGVTCQDAPGTLVKIRGFNITFNNVGDAMAMLRSAKSMFERPRQAGNSPGMLDQKR